MYIKQIRTAIRGKTYLNHLLVETVSTPKGPRSRTICSLGSLAPRPAEEWLKIANRMRNALIAARCNAAGLKPNGQSKYRKYYPRSAVERLEQALLARIEYGNDSLLPPIRVLAAQYGASESTVHKAVHSLCKQGLVMSQRGRRTTITRPQQDGRSNMALTESAHALAAHIREKIVYGLWKVGAALPKYHYFRLTFHISFDTIVLALKSLELRRIVHKQGKKWIAGPPPAVSAPSINLSAAGRRKAVLLLLNDVNSWQRMLKHDNNFYVPLVTSFMSEIEHAGLEMPIAYLDMPERNVGRPAGMQGISEFVGQLDERYAGALMWNLPAAGPLMQWLLRKKRPLVTFHRAPDLKNYSHAPDLFAWCVNNEADAVNLTLAHLADRGHRIIAVIKVDPFLDPEYWEGWVNNRAKIIQAAAKMHVPRLHIVPILQKEEFWFRHEWWQNEVSFLSFLLQEAARIHRGPTRAFSASNPHALMKLSPSLAAVVNHPRVTALIAPNDQLARLYSIWMKQAGIEIPGDISLTSFDNDIKSRNIPLTSVDFNMGRQGYLAAHFILGDIPVAPSRNRMLASKCTLIDRGTVGAPNPRKEPVLG